MTRPNWRPGRDLLRRVSPPVVVAATAVALFTLAAVGLGTPLQRTGDVIVTTPTDNEPTEAAPSVKVPDVEGLTVADAKNRLRAVGLEAGVLGGDGWSDPDEPQAVVAGHKPSHGEEVSRGAAIGLRTALVSPELCEVFTQLPPRRGDAHQLAGTDGYWQMLRQAEPLAPPGLAEDIERLLSRRHAGKPIEDAPARSLDRVTITHDACHAWRRGAAHEPGRQPDPPATVQADPEPAVEQRGPVPPSTVEGDDVVVPLRLADGTSIEVRYPADFDFTSRGYAPSVPAAFVPGYDRDAWLMYASRNDARARLGNVTMLATYRDRRGGEVELWRRRQDHIDHLVFDFGRWTVFYYDYRKGGAGPRMTDRDRQLWAESLVGQVDRDGFLVVHATPPLEFYDEGAHAAGASITGESGTIGITNARCESHPEQPLRGDEYVNWCDEGASLSINVFAAGDVLDALQDRVSVALVDP